MLIVENYNFWVLNDRVVSLLNDIPTAKYLIENIPSEVILAQIFNDKIKFGNLVFSITKPSIIVAPYYVIKALKEWDLIIHNEKISNESIVITNTEKLCDEKAIVINPYDVSSKLFHKKLISECGKDHNVELVHVKTRFNIDAKLPAVIYKNEAERLNLKYLNLNISVDFYISLFKNATNLEAEVYERLKEDIKGILLKNKPI